MTAHKSFGLLIATFHYPALMSPAGQLIGAYTLVFASNYAQRRPQILS